MKETAGGDEMVAAVKHGDPFDIVLLDVIADQADRLIWLHSSDLAPFLARRNLTAHTRRGPCVSVAEGAG